MSKQEALQNLTDRQADYDRHAHKPTNNPFRREAARSLCEAKPLAKAYAA